MVILKKKILRKPVAKTCRKTAKEKVAGGYRKRTVHVDPGTLAKAAVPAKLAYRLEVSHYSNGESNRARLIGVGEKESLLMVSGTISNEEAAALMVLFRKAGAALNYSFNLFHHPIYEREAAEGEIDLRDDEI